MRKLITEDVKEFLPLYLESIEWNDPYLNLKGRGWNFSSVCSWRVVYKDKLMSGCYDDDAQETIRKLENSTIEKVLIQSNELSVDPVFIFSNEFKLEFFSTTYYEPWVFGLPPGMVFVGSPSA